MVYNVGDLTASNCTSLLPGQHLLGQQLPWHMAHTGDMQPYILCSEPYCSHTCRVGAENVIASDVRTSRRMLDAGPFRSEYLGRPACVHNDRPTGHQQPSCSAAKQAATDPNSPNGSGLPAPIADSQEHTQQRSSCSRYATEPLCTTLGNTLHPLPLSTCCACHSYCDVLDKVGDSSSRT